MVSDSLQFNLRLNAADLQLGMTRARDEVTSGLRGMAKAAGNEARRIQDSLNAINLSRGLPQRIDEMRTALKSANTEADRLGRIFRQSQSEADRLTGRIGTYVSELSRLRQIPPAKRTEEQSQEIDVIKKKIQDLRSQGETVRTFTSTLRKDYKLAQASVAQLNNSLTEETEALTKLRSALAASGIATNNLTADQAKLQDRLARVRDVARSRNKIADAREILGVVDHRSIEREIQRVQSAYGRLNNSGTLTLQELGQAKLKMQERIRELHDQTNGWTQSLSRARTELLGLSVAVYGVVAGVGNAGRTFLDFEAEMAKVWTLVDVGPEKIQSLGNEVRALAVDMGKDAKESAAALYDILSSGVGLEQGMDVLRLASKAASAGVTDTTTAARAGVGVINAYGMEIGQLSGVYDVLFQTVKDGVISFEEVAQQIGEILPSAKASGTELNEVGAAMAQLTKAGIRAPQAATAIKDAITALAAPAPEAKRRLSELGIVWNGFTGTLQQISQLKPSMELMREIVPNEEARTAVLSLTGTFKEFQTELSSMEGATGATDSAYEKIASTGRHTMNQFKSAVGELAIQMGSLVAAGTPVIEVLTAMVKSINELNPNLKTLLFSVTGIIGVTAAWHLGLRRVWEAAVLASVSLRSSLIPAMRSLSITPLGMVLTAAGIAAYAFSKATASSVPPLLENAAALGKSREATAEKIKTLEALKKTLETTQPGTKAHTDAEEKLAAILPNANQSLDEQGRVLARVGNAASDNAGKLNAYLDLLKKDDRQTLALQLEAQTRAFGEAKKEMGSYTEGLRDWYGIGTGEAATGTQKFWLTLNKLTGTYDDNIAKGAELRRQLGDTQGGLKALLEDAHKAGLSVDDLGRAMDSIHADPAIKEQAVSLYRDMANAAEAATGKTASLTDQFKQFSDALAGPATAAKKVIVDAIGVADQQLGKYNEALGHHRGILKQAVDDESKSWKTMADISSRAFETTTQEIEDSYAQRRVMLQDDVDAYRGAERKKLESASDRARFEVEEKKFSQQAILQTTNDLVIKEHNSKLSRAQRFLTEALTLSEKEYRGRIDNAKRLGVEAGRIDEERLTAQKNILLRVEDAYRQNIDKLISEERRHRDAAKQLAEERKSFNESIADRVMNVKEKGMDPAEVYASRQNRIVQEQTLAEEALRAGNYELARKHAERMISLAEQTSDAVQVGDRTVIDSKAAAARAIEQMQKAAQIENQAFKGESEAHQQAANSLKEQSNSATESLAKIKAAIKSVDEDLAKEHVLLVDANIEKVHAAGMEIDALMEKKERVISIKAELQGGAVALGTVINDVLQGATSKAQASIDKVSRIFSRFKTEFDSFTPEVKANFDVASATSAIDGLMTKFNEFKVTVPPETKVLLLGDASQAMGEIDGLITRINEIPLEKTVIVNYVEKQAEAKANGGPVGFARGGFLPGWGSKDDVPAMLQRGEFVLRKEAVQRYGLGLIQSMNQMRIRPGTIPGFAYGGLVRAIHNLTDLYSSGTRDIPHFASGGLLRNLVIPELPRMAFAGGGSVSPQVTEVVRLDISNNNRPVTSITAPRDEVRNLVRGLKDMKLRSM